VSNYWVTWPTHQVDKGWIGLEFEVSFKTAIVSVYAHACVSASVWHVHVLSRQWCWRQSILCHWVFPYSLKN
jgi:hypothetical protein